MDGLTGCDNHVWKGRESRMKKKKYGWPRRCLSLICVMVLISMIVLQSVPVTYVSGSDDSEWLNMEPDPFTSEPEGNLQMTETSNMEPEQENNPFSDGTTSDGVTEVSEEPQLTETPEVPSNRSSGSISDRDTGNIPDRNSGTVSDGKTGQCRRRSHKI